MKLVKNPILNLILNFLLVLLYQTLALQASLFFARIVPDPTVWFNLPLCLHHVMLLLFGLAPVVFFTYFRKLDFGFHFSSWKSWLFWFLPVLGFSFAVALIVGLCNGFTDMTEMSSSDYVSDISFQLFFSGTGEEILFRSLPYVILLSSYGKPLESRIGKKSVIDWIVILTALLFSFAHCSYEFGGDYFEFSVTQLIVTFLFGVLMGYCFRKTKDVLLCMTLHGLENTLMIVFSLLFSLICYGK